MLFDYLISIQKLWIVYFYNTYNNNNATEWLRIKSSEWESMEWMKSDKQKTENFILYKNKSGLLPCMSNVNIKIGI